MENDLIQQKELSLVYIFRLELDVLLDDDGFLSWNQEVFLDDFLVQGRLVELQNYFAQVYWSFNLAVNLNYQFSFVWSKDIKKGKEYTLRV